MTPEQKIPVSSLGAAMKAYEETWQNTEDHGKSCEAAIMAALEAWPDKSVDYGYGIKAIILPLGEVK